MFRLLPGLLVVALITNPASAQKDKDPPKKDLKEEKVKIKTVDAKASTITVATAEGKTVVLKINEKDVKILGPRGGKTDGFKDDRMAAGHELTLFYAADGKTLKEIRFAVRKSEPEKDKPRDKPKDK